VDSQPVKKAQKSRGIALYKNNSIQLVGNPFIHEGDEIIVSDKAYVLKPKPPNNKLTIGIFAAVVAVILIGIGSLFIGSGVSDEGAIVGIILDKSGKPYLEETIVSIPSLKKKTRTNAQGFFRFDLIPTGTYKITYDLGNGYSGEGNITVSGGQTSLMSFGDLNRTVHSETKREKPKQQISQTVRESRPRESKPAAKKESAPPTTTAKRGKIKLDANVENARLVLEGQILGAGNMVYSEIRPGTRNIKVDKKGYKDYTANIVVEPGKTTTVNAVLTKLESKSAKLTADDYFERGQDALKQNDLSGAVTEFTKAIKNKPGMAKAYESRAGAYSKSGQKEKAVNDYVRAGEIYRIDKKTNKAVAVFSNAFELDSENIPALIGRAGAKRDRSDYRSALIDYDLILDIDRKNYDALYGSGVCEFKLGNHKYAEKWFKKAHKINNSDPNLYQFMMLTYFARDKFKAVQKTYDEFKTIANPGELAEFKSSSRFEPILRVVKEEGE
jgi:tetratricopeptide (TPR) repeat protein